MNIVEQLAQAVAIRVAGEVADKISPPTNSSFLFQKIYWIAATAAGDAIKEILTGLDVNDILSPDLMFKFNEEGSPGKTQTFIEILERLFSQSPLTQTFKIRKSASTDAPCITTPYELEETGLNRFIEGLPRNTIINLLFIREAGDAFMARTIGPYPVIMAYRKSHLDHYTESIQV
jgi:hypothetical protein